MVIPTTSAASTSTRLNSLDAQIVAYKDEEAMLENPNLYQSPGFGVPYSTKADILVSDGDELKVGDVTLKFIHTPGDNWKVAR